MARITYNASQLDDMRTLLTKLNYIRQLLEEYPSQQWFYDDTESITGNIGETYTINTSNLELLGRSPVISDFVITYDSNGDAWVGQITALGETQVTITILGKLGYKGDTGATGPTGPTGPSGANGVSITNVQVNASNHLVVTLSNGNTIDAGQIATGGSVDLTPFLKSGQLTASSPLVATATLGADGFTSVALSVNANYKVPTTTEWNKVVTTDTNQTINGTKSFSSGINTTSLTSNDTTINGTIEGGYPSGKVKLVYGSNSGETILQASNNTSNPITLTLPNTSGNIALTSDIPSGMTNPMTNVGDLIVGSTSGTPSRIPIGTNGQVLTSNGTTASWQDASGGSGLTGYTLTYSIQAAIPSNILSIIYLYVDGNGKIKSNVIRSDGTYKTGTLTNVLMIKYNDNANYNVVITGDYFSVWGSSSALQYTIWLTDDCTYSAQSGGGSDN